VNPGSLTGSNATGDGDWAVEVGDGDWGRSALAGVEVDGNPETTPEGDAELPAPADPHAHSKIAAIAASLMTT
jgi:hypothetical protein